jgi:hypothetical protein
VPSLEGFGAAAAGVDTTSSFHFLTISLALMEMATSWCVLNFPRTLPISVFYRGKGEISTISYLIPENGVSGLTLSKS